MVSKQLSSYNLHQIKNITKDCFDTVWRKILTVENIDESGLGKI